MDRNIEHILDTGGRNLSPTDRQFVSTLCSELEQFQYQAPKDRALMFHPLGGYQRYLIHKVTEIFPKLTSFSIGDDQNRRTVVCFKSKRKEQQQQMGQPSPEKQPPRGKNSNYSSLPASRRGSKGHGKLQHDPGTEKPGSKRGKHPDQTTHLPKPLRSKKASKQSNSMPRSRSLHASPARQPEKDQYYTDDDGRRKHKNERGDGTPSSRRKADLHRSASMKDTRKSRSRPTSPRESVNRGKSKTLPKSATELSLERRGHGLRLEGMVVNGDVEDPYNRDTDTDLARSDAEVLRREKSRRHDDNRGSKKKHKMRRARSEPESESDRDELRRRGRNRSDLDESPVRLRSDSDDEVRNKPRKRSSSASQKRKKDKTLENKQKAGTSGRHKPTKPSNTDRQRDGSEESRDISDVPRHHKPSRNKPQDSSFVDESFSESDVADHDSGVRSVIHDDLENNHYPPSYAKSAELPPSPMGKARRNLNRIRRADSLRSSAVERSPSNSSTRSESMIHEEEPSRQTTSTFPRHPKHHPYENDDVPEGLRSDTNPKGRVGSGAEAESTSHSDVPKRRKSTGSKLSKKHPRRAANKSPEIKVRSQTDITVPSKARENLPNHSGWKQEENFLKHPSEDNILASDATLYMPLPTSTVAPPEKPEDKHEYVNRPLEPETRRTPSSHSTLSSPATVFSQGFKPSVTTMPVKCDGEAQTDMSGTLSRKSNPRHDPMISELKAVSPPTTLENRSQDSPSYHTAASSIPSNSTTPSAPSNEKLMEEFCKMMLNFQKMFIVSQNPNTANEPGFSSPSHGPALFQPFASYYPQRNNPDAPTAPIAPPASLYNQFPPHIAHQLYLSWMAAYYAGATGSWPPPPPPYLAQPKEKSKTTQYEYQTYMPLHSVPPGAYPGFTDERGKGDYHRPMEANIPLSNDAGSYRKPPYDSYQNFEDSPEYFSPHHPTCFNQPQHKGSSDKPESFNHSDHDRFPSVSGTGSHIGERSSQGSGCSRTRGRPANKWPSSEHSFKSSEPARHRSNSTALTDGGDTDVSSATSSSTHPEVALKQGKGGVMVYVRSGSQSNSRANSTVSGGEDAISLHSSSSHGLSMVTNTVSSAKVKHSPTEEKANKKKSKDRNEDRKHSKKGAKDKNAATPKRLVDEDEMNSKAGTLDSKNDPRYPSIVLISSPADSIRPPPGFGSHPDVSGISEEANETQNKGVSGEISSNLETKGKQVKRVESNIASEEVLLSLSKAPLALMDDDDELGSTSAASSYSSFQLKSKLQEEKNGSKTSLHSSDPEYKPNDKSSVSSSQDSVPHRSSDPEYDSKGKSQRFDSRNPLSLQDHRPEAELAEGVTESSGKTEKIDSESYQESSEDGSSDEEGTHIYDTSSARNIILPSVSDDESSPGAPAVSKESLTEHREELTPPPTYEDLDDVMMDEVRKLIAAGKASGQHKAPSGSNSGSDFEMLDSDRGRSKDNKLDDSEEDKNVKPKASLVEDDSGKVERSNEDVSKDVSDVNDPESLLNDDPLKFLPPTTLSSELKQQGGDVGLDDKDLELKSSSLLGQAGSPMGLDLGSIPHIDDGSDSLNDSETESLSNFKKNIGYDADRSSNLGPEEMLEEAQPVNGLTNGPGVHSEELNDHVKGKITVQEPQYDYHNWTPNEQMYSSEPYNSIIEIHDFPPEYKDGDIMKYFSTIPDFKLVWVDDIHALGMFPTSEAATTALKMSIPDVRLRPLVHASTKSRKKAKMRVEEFGDYAAASTQPRPKTTNVVAKKMITSALGLPESKEDREKRAELRKLRQSRKKKENETAKQETSM